MTDAELSTALHEYGHCADEWIRLQVEESLDRMEVAMIAEALTTDDPRYGIMLAVQHCFARMRRMTKFATEHA